MAFLRGSIQRVLWLLFFTSPVISAQQYRIEVAMSGLSADTLILGEYFTTRMVPLDTIILDQQGDSQFHHPMPIFLLGELGERRTLR